MSLDAIFEEINNTNAEEITMKALREIIALLLRDAIQIINECTEEGKNPQYRVNLGDVVTYLKRKVKHSIAGKILVHTHTRLIRVRIS